MADRTRPEGLNSDYARHADAAQYLRLMEQRFPKPKGSTPLRTASEIPNFVKENQSVGLLLLFVQIRICRSRGTFSFKEHLIWQQGK